MTMNVGDLKHILDSLDDDTEIRIAMQPSWPLQFSLQDEFIVKHGTLFLGEEYNEGYLTEGIAYELGW